MYYGGNGLEKGEVLECVCNARFFSSAEDK